MKLAALVRKAAPKKGPKKTMKFATLVKTVTRAKKARGRATRRSTASNTQGVGATPAPGTIFGSVDSPHPKLALNAFHPHHAALPRAVGPYTVCRVTTRFSSNAVVTMVGVEKYMPGVGETSRWTSGIARASNVAATAVNAPNNCTVYGAGGTAGLTLNSCTLVPSAVSLQLMNPESLQTTDGVVYVGRSTAQWALAGNPNTWQDIANDFVAFQSPRLCAAAKLALQGVQVDACPLNMDALADFSQLDATNSGTTTWDGGLAPATGGQTTGWTPIIVYNPGSIALEYLVCVEYRVRFDPTNVAAASHRHHGVTSDRWWDGAVRRMSAMGHGVEDIVSRVAEIGSLVESGARLARALPRVPL